jgi:hypothetical protein
VIVRAALICLLFLVFASAACAHYLPPETSTLTACRTASPPQIDGALSDACWSGATPTGPFVLLGQSTPAAQATEGYLCWDDDNLYVGMVCDEDAMDRLVAEERARDDGQWRDDCVEVVLQPQKDYYHFILTTIGSRYDAVTRNGEADESWNPEWQYAVRKDADRWSAEIAIPFAILAARPKVGERWRANLCREEQPHGELSTWSAGHTGFEEPERFGTLVFADEAPRLTVTSWGALLSTQPVWSAALEGLAAGRAVSTQARVVLGSERGEALASPEVALRGGDTRIVAEFPKPGEGQWAIIASVRRAGRWEYRHVLPFFIPAGLPSAEAPLERLDALQAQASGLGLGSAAGEYASMLTETRQDAHEMAAALTAWTAATPWRDTGRRLQSVLRKVSWLEQVAASYENPEPVQVSPHPLATSHVLKPLSRYFEARDRLGYVVWLANPWLDFEAEVEPERLASVEAVEMHGAQGETKNLALMVSNISERPLTLRVEASPLRSEAGASLGTPTVRRAVWIRRGLYAEETVADPLARLDGAGLLEIPPGETRQLFVSLATEGAPAGAYAGALRLRPLAFFDERTIGLTLTVHPVELELGPAPRICTWGAILGITWATPDAMPYLEDAAARGVNVFFVPPPFVLPKLDKEGNIVAPIDWTKHDEYVNAYRKYGLIVEAYSAAEYFDEVAAAAGIEFMSPAYRKAYSAWITEWVAHLKAMGLDYDDFAFQLYDEPSEGVRYEKHVAVGRLMKEIDPKARVVITANSRNLDRLRALATGVDIWVPHISTLRDEAAMEFIRSSGKEIWCYACEGWSKTLHPISYYRLLPWEAAHYGATGWGFFAHMWWGEDTWGVWGARGSEKQDGSTYSTVYPGADGPVSSRRWEAYNEGRQDYLYLRLLAERAARGDAAAATLLKEAAALAMSLLREGYPTRLPADADPNALEVMRARMLEALLR